MTNKILSIKLALAAVFCFVISLNVQADIGVVTIDGEDIPPVLFQQYKPTPRGYVQPLCPPKSDEYVRNTIIIQWLTARKEKEKLDQIILADQRTRKRFARLDDELVKWQNFESTHKDSGPEYKEMSTENIRRVEAKILEAKFNVFQSVMHANAVQQDYEDEYRRLVDEKDPMLVNVTAYYLSYVAFREESDGIGFAQKANSGIDIPQAIKGIEHAHWGGVEKAQWTVDDPEAYFAQRFLHYEPLRLKDIATLPIGKVTGPYNIKNVLTHNEYTIYFVLHQKKLIPQLNTDEYLNGIENWTLDYAARRYFDRQMSEYVKALREEFSIKENGKAIELVALNLSCS